MAVIDLTSRPQLVSDNKRPTVATPVLNRGQIAKCAEDNDKALASLYCVFGTLNGTTGVPDEAIVALEDLYTRLRRNNDNILALG
jgi:hypothetical protein